MRTTYAEVRKLSTRDLIQALLTDTENGHIIRPVIRERLTASEETHVYDLCIKDAKNGGQEEPPWSGDTEVSEPSKKDFPWMDEELVLTWIANEQVWQFAEKVKASGYQGKGMTNPEEAMDWVETAIFSKTEWRELHPQAVRFWKALRSKWSKWMATKKK